MDSDNKMLQQKLKAMYPSEYSAKRYEELFNSVEGIENAKRLVRNKLSNNLRSELLSCVGANDWRMYQKLCFNLVKTTIEESEFVNVSTKYEDRTKYEVLDASGQRRDILLTNNPSDTGTNNVWIRFKNEWDCKILIFDSKFYKNELTDKEIYQMFGYLSGTTSKVGFIISKTGKCSRKAVTALRRIRQVGYGVIVFSNSDILEWIQEYEDSGTVQKIFFNKYEELSSSYTP